MRYRLRITGRAARELRKLPAKVRARIEAAIEAAVSRLADDPRPPGCVKLHGAAGWRIRVGDYRILYDIEDDVLTVTVLRAGHRRDVYRGL